MSQHRVRAERRIDAPVEDVWAVVDDTSRYAEWVDGCLEVTRHHGSATVGDTYGERNSTLGPLIATTTWTVLEVEPHVRRVDAGEGLAPLRDFRNVFTFTPTSDGRGTLMTYEVTFGLALLIEEIVQFFWGKNIVPFEEPAALQFALFNIGGNAVPAYKVFMIFVAIAIFLGLLYVLTKTRVGMIIQAALSYPKTVEALGHNVPLIFMGVFGVGTALAGVAGVIAGPVLGTFPGMAFLLGSIVFVTIVIGGLGSLFGALVASLLIGWLTTFAATYNFEFASILTAFGMERPEDLSESYLRDLWVLTLPQIGPILPYLLMVLILVVRPYGLFGKRDA